MSIHVYHHIVGENEKLDKILLLLENIMATQAELAAKLNEVNNVLTKIGAEITALQAGMQELKDALAAQPEVSPELQAAVDSLASHVKTLDEMNDDLPTP